MTNMKKKKKKKISTHIFSLSIMVSINTIPVYVNPAMSTLLY